MKSRRLTMIGFDDIQTDTGCLQYLLAAESLGPLDPAYNFAQMKIVLRAMNATLQNRKRLAKPWVFCASGATTIRDFICAPISTTGCQYRQFDGFTQTNSKVQITAAISSRIADLVHVANDAANSHQAAAEQHVREIIAVANGTFPDPYSSIPNTINGVSVRPGVFGWKTAGAAGPGGSYVKIPPTQPPLAYPDGVLQNIQFYTIKAEVVALSEDEFLKSIFV